MDDLTYFDEEYADAIIGYSEDNRVVYSYEKMIECLMMAYGYSRDDAAEDVDYNISGFHPGGVACPIIVYETPR